MKYFYIKSNEYYPIGKTYKCNHSLFTYCTLYSLSYYDNNKGLAVIQQRFDPETKTIRWSELDPWLNYDIYHAPGFEAFLKEYSKEPKDGLYPTIPVRKLMWALRMKPLPLEDWESQKSLLL